MKIDWKHLATTPGYISLKKAYTQDITKGYRSKKESYRKFKWVISRAIHYANHTGKSLERVLNVWESKRDYWWLNYYQESNQPKFHSGGKKNPSVRTYFKTDSFYKNDPKRRRELILKHIMLNQEKESTKFPKRWSMRKKKQYIKYRELGIK